MVAETFWVDVALRNPLNVDVNIANLTVVVEDSSLAGPLSFVSVEVIDEVILEGRESRIVCLPLLANYFEG
jgi:hypothetical protein